MENTTLEHTTQQEQDVKHVGVREQMAFNISALLRDMSYAIFGQIHNFLIDVLRLEPSQIAILPLVQRLWDGINDPLVGAYFDRSAYANEKARRYFKLTALPIAILLVLMFSPFRFSDNATLNTWLHMGFILLCYMPFDPLHSLNGTAFMSYYNSISPNIEERSGIIARSRLFSTFGSAAVGGGLPLFYSLFSDGPEDYAGRARIFLVLAIVIAVGFLIYNWLMHSQVKERIISPPQAKQKIWRIFFGLLKNKMFLILVLSNTIGGIINRGNTDLRLFEHNIGDAGWQTLVGLAGLPALLVATWLWPRLCHRFEKRNIVIGSSAVRWVIRALYLFLGTRTGPFNLTIFNPSLAAKLFMAVFGFLNEIPNAIRGQIYWSMLADSVDFGEYKIGKRNDGVIYTMEGLLGKIFGSIGAASTGIILGFIGFEVGVADQSPRAMRGLFTVPLSIELVSIAASTVPFFFYDLKRDDHARMINEIKIRAELAEEPAEIT